ncbi:hypothetical protein [Paenibacillus sp. GCM10012303]|jgi:hypothetical protein|uniref:hypothetical protein n=1 Tax=Paenibacillus sp. GCM10012303 TaxID=3317340 RepID=UPI0036185ECD
MLDKEGRTAEAETLLLPAFFAIRCEDRVCGALGARQAGCDVWDEVTDARSAVCPVIGGGGWGTTCGV